MQVIRTRKRKNAFLIVLAVLILICLSRRLSADTRIVESSSVHFHLDGVVPQPLQGIGTSYQSEQSSPKTDENNSPNSMGSMKNGTILFVHVGKAGGETIKNVLPMGCQVRRNAKRRKTCYEALPNNGISRLGELVKGYYHCFQMKPTSDYPKIADSFLINIRHPVDRILSWYWYIHPSNCLQKEGGSRNTPNCEAARQIAKFHRSQYNHPRDSSHVDINNNNNNFNTTTNRTLAWFVVTFFQKCFPDPERWAYWATKSPILSDNNKNNNNNNNSSSSKQPLIVITDPSAYVDIRDDDCITLARRSLTGVLDRTQIPLAAHLIANYRQYTDATMSLYPDKRVWVVRMEYLWNDMQRIEQNLGGSPGRDVFGTAVGSQYTHGSESFRNNANRNPISSQAITQFCCVLSSELLIYKQIVFRAANLDQMQKQETWNGAITRCGFDSWGELMNQCQRYTDQEDKEVNYLTSYGD